MRWTVYLRGIDLIDVELHAGKATVAVFQPREDDSTDEGPTLQATAGGQFEAATVIEPDTKTFGYSQRPESMR